MHKTLRPKELYRTGVVAQTVEYKGLGLIPSTEGTRRKKGRRREGK
jgi:hypothetical protein